MNATLTLDLFRPSILDPVEDEVRFPSPTSGAGVVAVAAGERRPALAPVSSGGLTLDDLVVGVWEGLSAHRTVACPACGGAMAPRYGAGHAPVGGRCTTCATTIA